MQKKIFKTLFLIAILLCLLSCKESKNSEIEPNNTFSQANQIELNSEIYGYLDSNSDVDNFVFQSMENQIVKIELSGVKGVNHAMQIWRVENSSVIPLKIIDDNRKSSPEEIANLHTPPGIYIITVMHGTRDEKKGNTENPYMLKTTSRQYISEEEEPNDKYTDANLISSGVQLYGFYSPGQNLMNEQNEFREEDWFKFIVEEGEELPLIADIHLKGVSGVDSVLKLFNSELKEIAMADNSAIGGDEAITGIGISNPGTYYIQIFSKNYQYNNNEPYVINFSLNKHEAGTELEDNNTIDKANLISGNEIQGKINYANDVDFFLYQPEIKNSLYRIELIPSSVIDPVITVYDEKKHRIIEADNTGTGEIEVIPNLLLSGSAYFSVSSRSGFDNNSDYTLRIRPFKAEWPMEKEPNNKKEEANLIDKKISGYITGKDDIDYFLVRHKTRQRLKVKVKGVKNGIIKVSTTDPLGYIIRTVEVKDDQEVEVIETFDTKGYIIVEPVKAAYDYPYYITIEEAG